MTKIHKIKQYIFLTAEGSTFQPDSLCIEPDVENLQVVGFANGSTAQKAFERLLKENPYLFETNFDEIFSIALADSTKKTYFSLKNGR
ncbi:MAG: hypothetical protein KAW47_05890 [Thermoplasmatales archaeon]|nr:hypothetical protein [Thermoplasmatales archaeon]